ncbi:MAG: membrane dipeptidase [Ignavibacteria bacterium]|nr:membrane dipeptidase [Ignavibacteria bacterium]
MRKIILILILIITAQLYPQSVTISGVIRDKQTGSGLDSAYLILINKNNLAQRDTFFANQSGFFSFILASQNEGQPIKDFYISNPYPNPFNPSVNIEVYLPSSDAVTVEVYNLLGKLIDQKTFILSQGRHRISYDGKGSAGIYFIVIKYKGKTSVKKIVQLDYVDGSGLKIFSNQNFTTKIYKNTITSFYLIASRFLYVHDTIEIDNSQNHQLIFNLETVHSYVTLIDLHNDVLEKVVQGYDIGILNSINHSDLPRFYKGGVDVQFMALWVSPTSYPNNPFQQTLKMIDSFKVQLNKYNSIFAQARSSREIDSLTKIRKFAAVLCVEGGHAIEDNLQKLDSLYNLGVRYLTITWNNSTSWATSAQDPQASTKGLSEFGRQVIRRMDSLGMIIDVSHVGPKTIDDILETTNNPIIASHSGARTLRNHYRNLTDQQIIKIAQKGGVIGVIFYPPYLTSASTANISHVIAHIEHIKNLVGIDYIALGSDFDGIERVVVGLEDVSKFPNLTEALLRRGYSISDIRKIYGENFLRVFRQVCK